MKTVHSNIHMLYMHINLIRKSITESKIDGSINRGSRVTTTWALHAYENMDDGMSCCGYNRKHAMTFEAREMTHGC